MRKLTREHVVFAMDKRNVPAMEVDPGAAVLFHTEDCFSHPITDEEQALGDDFDYSLINPLAPDRGVFPLVDTPDYLFNRQGFFSHRPLLRFILRYTERCEAVKKNDLEQRLSGTWMLYLIRPPCYSGEIRS